MNLDNNFMNNHVYRQQEKNNQPLRKSLEDLDNDLLGNQANSRPSPANQTSAAVDVSEIDIELFNRLLKTGVMKANPSIKTQHDRKTVLLDQKNSEIFVNGVAFAHYLLVLKNVVR